MALTDLRHRVDPEQSNLIECPNHPDAFYTWGDAVPGNGDLPPFCMACGSRVSVWWVRDELGEWNPVKSAPSPRDLDVEEGSA